MWPLEHGETMTTTQHPTDHQLKDSILAELGWIPSVSADRIGVSINEGAVTLSGQVQTYPEKDAAVRAAFRVHGVTAVADEIEVHNDWAPRQDADIAREATELLERTVFAPAGSVKAEVHDHVVHLTGSVTWHYQRDAIQRAVSALPGVHGVHDTITLKPRVTISVSEAKTKIVAALHRNAVVEAERIHVDVAGDKITLTGTVATWAEHAQASYAAWATPGVVHVDNELHVTY
jgi:osmotically-inducible protein OsmY